MDISVILTSSAELAAKKQLNYPHFWGIFAPKWGQFGVKYPAYFWGVIAPASFYFALYKNRHGWTEVDASNRAYNFFGKPRWWRFDYYPINP